MSEPILFLGGPLDGQRKCIPRDVWTVVERRVHRSFATDPLDDILEQREVVYTRRRAPGSREWVFVAPGYRFDTAEWVQAAFPPPRYTDWQPRGPWYWRGWDNDLRYWLYVLGEEQGGRFVGHRVSRSAIGQAQFDIDAFVREQLQYELDWLRLPACVVAGCGDKAPMVFVASERGRLAGRWWKPGDEIRLCPLHAHDVYRAQGVYGVDQLAEWLRPDALLDPLDAFDAETDLIYGSEIAQSRRRMLRVHEWRKA